MTSNRILSICLCAGICIGLLVSCVPISTKAFAQETAGPSLLETREFIQKHLQTSTFNYSNTVWKGRPEEKTEFGTISQTVAGDTNVKFPGNSRCFVIDPGVFMKLPFAFVSFLLTFGSIASGGASPSFVPRGTGHFTTGAEFAQVGSPEFHQAFQRALALADSNQLTSLRGEPEEVTEGASPSFKTSFILQWRACSLIDDSPWTLDCSIDTDRTGSNLQALFTQVTAEAESLGTLEKLPRRRIDNPNQNRYRSPAGSVVDINAVGKTFIQVTFASPPLARKNSAK